MSQPHMAEQALPENHSKNIIFNKYETGRVLGKGTFAKVYHGRHLITGESVAIKVIDKEKLKKQGMIDRIEREVSVMRMVRHPNIVELKEVMATKGKVFFVMEYVKGGELFAKVVKGKLKEDVARKYFQQLVSAVDFCHSRGVYHRDLKPENLLLNENGDLKVSDFGLSALAEQFQNDGLLHTPCGTPSYVAPEVLRKKGYDGSKADIWSCGVILYVLLSGILPFQEENVMNMYRKIFKADYECPSWISTEANDLISKLLVVNAGKRYSIQEITRHAWFQAGCPKPVSFQAVQEPGSMDITDYEDDKKSDGREMERTKSPPPFYNAFNLISSFSPGFDLSSLFESKRKSSSIFTSKCSASAVVTKLEMLAKKMNYKLTSKKNFNLEMQGNSEGRKGKLGVSAKVFEVAPEVAAVEFSKSSGDTWEYNKFCGEDVRTALKDIVWSWQGEDAVDSTK